MSEVKLAEPVKAEINRKLLDQEWEAGYKFAAGVYAFHDDFGSMWFACPCGCGDVRYIPIGTSPGGWLWNGLIDKPTLTPSILMHEPRGGPGTHWHGHLKDGYWVNA